MFEKISVISIPVKDQDRAKQFFVERLGFSVVKDEPYMDGARWIELAPKGADTNITLTTWFDAMPSGSLQGLVLKTGDITAAHAAVSESDATDVTPVDAAPWGSSFMFTDTEGNGWIVQQD